MISFLSDYYLWIKSFHLIFVISWMAGLFYLPRLFVYHAQTSPRSEMSDQFLIMEQRLIKIIMNPAMILTFFFGGLLLLIPGIVNWNAGWLHVKLLLVFILAGLHGLFIKSYKGFAAERRDYSSRFFRFANEIPVLIMIIIIVMVIVRPF